MSEVLVVVPCYNEASRLDPDAFVSALDDLDWMRLLLVDDGSTDATRSCLEELASRRPNRIDVLGLDRNGGKGEAVRQGMQQAFESGAELVAFWDADLATPFSELPPMRDRMLEGDAIVVMGSRIRLLGRRIDRDGRRHYLGRVFATAVSLVTGVAVYDTQCGAKLFRNTPVVQSAFQAPFTSRWIFDVELLVRLCEEDGQAGIVEYPLREWRDVAGSKLRAKDFLQAAVDLARIVRNRPG